VSDLAPPPVETPRQDDEAEVAATEFLRAAGLKPNADAVDQLVYAFLPALKIICTRPHAGDGSSWKLGGWRGMLYEIIKKTQRVKEQDWFHEMGAVHEAVDLINYWGFYMRGRSILTRWGSTGDPGNEDSMS
jgi:hypothetical protein